MSAAEERWSELRRAKGLSQNPQDRVKDRSCQYISMVWLLRQFKCRAAAEIGVYLGLAAEYVLRELGSELETYLMVDPWRPYSQRGSCPPMRGSWTWEKLYKHTCAVAEPYLCAQILRMTSLEAAAKRAPASLDLVFIDGDHSYEAVRADIKAWLPALKPSGVLAGHDFYKPFPGVIQAVTEAFPWELLEWLPDTIWYVKNPLRGIVST